jgi:hypothetical protein
LQTGDEGIALGTVTENFKMHFTFISDVVTKLSYPRSSLEFY